MVSVALAAGCDPRHPTSGGGTAPAGVRLELSVSEVPEGDPTEASLRVVNGGSVDVHYSPVVFIERRSDGTWDRQFRARTGQGSQAPRTTPTDAPSDPLSFDALIATYANAGEQGPLERIAIPALAAGQYRVTRKVRADGALASTKPARVVARFIVASAQDPAGVTTSTSAPG